MGIFGGPESRSTPHNRSGVKEAYWWERRGVRNWGRDRGRQVDVQTDGWTDRQMTDRQGEEREGRKAETQRRAAVGDLKVQTRGLGCIDWVEGCAPK